jgi:ComF family protein
MISAPQSIFAAAFKVLLPNYCRICDSILEDQDLMCEDCKTLVSRIRGQVCDRCGLPLRGKTKAMGVCLKCDKSVSELTSLRAYGIYEQALEKLIQQLKLHYDLNLTDYFASKLSRIYTLKFGNEKKHDCIATVPHHRFTLVKRGFDHLFNLGSALSHRLQIPYSAELLIKPKWTRPQHNKSLAERKTNIGCDSFKVNRHENWDGKRILLVDDVVTTGTTLNACAERLRASYRNIEIDGLAIAMTRRD